VCTSGTAPNCGAEWNQICCGKGCGFTLSVVAEDVVRKDITISPVTDVVRGTWLNVEQTGAVLVNGVIKSTKKTESNDEATCSDLSQLLFINRIRSITRATRARYTS
jgi:hypothetical protein